RMGAVWPHRAGVGRGGGGVGGQSVLPGGGRLRLRRLVRADRRLAGRRAAAWRQHDHHADREEPAPLARPRPGPQGDRGVADAADGAVMAEAARAGGLSQRRRVRPRRVRRRGGGAPDVRPVRRLAHAAGGGAARGGAARPAALVGGAPRPLCAGARRADRAARRPARAAARLHAMIDHRNDGGLCMTIADDDPTARVEASGGRHVMVRPGGTVLWRLWGDSGRRLVLLHGASGAWTHWIRNIPALSEHSRVIAPDMPGFGMSDLLPATHTADALADLVAEGIEEVVPGSETFDLAGFSFGGIIAGLVAARLGVRVRTLVLFGPGGLGLPRSAMPALVPVQPGMTDEAVRQVHRDNLRILMIADPAKVDPLAVTLQIDNLRRARFRSGRIPESDALVR